MISEQAQAAQEEHEEEMPKPSPHWGRGTKKTFLRSDGTEFEMYAGTYDRCGRGSW